MAMPDDSSPLHLGGKEKLIVGELTRCVTLIYCMFVVVLFASFFEFVKSLSVLGFVELY